MALQLPWIGEPTGLQKPVGSPLVFSVSCLQRLSRKDFKIIYHKKIKSDKQEICFYVICIIAFFLQL
jgi:hypothetical protein